MTVASAHLSSGSSSTDGGPFVTGAISPSAGKLYLAAVMLSGTNPAPDVSGMTGWGLTWVQVAAITGNGIRNVQIFAAVGTPTSGTLTFTPGTGNVATACAWSVAELTGADITAGAAAAVVQNAAARVAGNATSSVTLTNPVASGNATFGAFGAGEILTPVAPSVLVGATSHTAPVAALTATFSGVGQQTIAATASSAIATVPVGIEIKAAATTLLDKLRVGSVAPSAIYIEDRPVSQVFDGPTQVWP